MLVLRVRQFLPSMQVHGRSQGDIGDGRVVASYPGAVSQAIVENAGELVELGIVGSQHVGVRDRKSVV